MPSTPTRAIRFLALGAALPLAGQSPTPEERLRAPLALSISEAFRLGFSATGAGARATGMGGAFVAVADDGTAASFNPAGLAQLRTFEVALVGRRSSFDLTLGATPDAKGTGFALDHDRIHGTSPAEPQFISLAAPFNVGGRNLVLQLSRQRVFGMNLGYTRDWYSLSTVNPGQYQSLSESIAQKGDLTRWTLAGACEVSPRMLLGVAWNQWRGRWDTHADSYGYQSPQRFRNAQQSAATLDQSSHLEGRNLTWGLLWRGEDVRVGLAYQAPFTAQFFYGGHFRGVAETNLVTTIEGPIEVGGRVYDVHWPETLSMGASLRPHPQWQVALDWSRTPWAKARFEAPGSLFDGQNFLDPAPPNQTLDPLQNPGQPGPGKPVTTQTFRFGVEHLMLVRRSVVPVRAGWFVEPQPLRDPVSGANRVFRGFTVGTGLKAGNLTLDLAWKLGRSRRMTGSMVTPLSLVDNAKYGGLSGLGEEKVTTRELVASVILQFKGEGLRKAFRWLLVSGE